MEMKEILLVDARTPISAALGFILQTQGHLILLAPDVATAAAELNDHRIDLLLTFLTGDVEEKLDLLRLAKRRFPHVKVMVAGDPRKMAWQAFQEEVDDYLLTPFSPAELCRRVRQCLNQSNIPKHGSVFKDDRDATNTTLLNSLRLKFCQINSILFSLITNINIHIQKNHGVQKNNNLINIIKISDDLMSMISIAEELFSNQLLCIDLNHSCGEEKYAAIQIGAGRIATTGRH